MKRYFKTNKDALSFINNKKYIIESITTVKKKIKKGKYSDDTISSYCIKYQKMI